MSIYVHLHDTNGARLEKNMEKHEQNSLAWTTVMCVCKAVRTKGEEERKVLLPVKEDVLE